MKFPRWLCYTLTHKYEWSGDTRRLQCTDMEGVDVWHLCILRPRTCSRCGLQQLIEVEAPYVEEFHEAVEALGLTELTWIDLMKAQAFINESTDQGPRALQQRR